MVKLSCHLAPWGVRYAAGLAAAQASGFRYCEAGSNLVFAYERDLSKLRELLAASETSLSSVFELGHFDNRKQKRELDWHHQRLARLMSKLDADFVVLAPGFSFSRTWNAEAANRMAGSIAETAKRYTDQGITVGLHPHLGSLFFTEEQIDTVMEKLPEHILLVPDLGHLAEAGIDIAAWLKKYAARIGNIHLKDVIYLPQSRQDAASRYPLRIRRTRFCALGEGELDLASWLPQLPQTGCGGLLTAELEGSEDELRKSASDAMAYLRKLFEI